MTNAINAEQELASTSADVRLRAARFFALQARPVHLPLLQRALKTETVPWIKRALERAIDLATNAATHTTTHQASQSEEEPSTTLIRDLRAEAVEEVADTILHEFAPIIGSIKLAAAVEFPAFANSRTRQLVDQLSALLAAIRNLKRAAAIPKYTQFDLVELVNDTITVLAKDNVLTRVAGVSPFVVEADKGSLHLALMNGLRNAIEAVSDHNSAIPPEIIINWGRAGVENWLVVMDNGPGFVGNPSDALSIGVSNKKDHLGYGLATAQYAMRSMEGDVVLSNNDKGGARFELRWYKDNANTTS